MKILIYGSSGFVGRYVVEALKDNTLILPMRDREKAENLFKDYENIHITHLDRYKPGISIEMEKPDIVINLVGILKEDPDRDTTFEKVHFEFSKQLIDSSLKSNVKKFIQMSALGADINSKSRYLKTKAMAEQYLINSGLDYIIFRPSIIMGREQKLFQDLRKYAKISPFFFAPIDAKVQPVHILDVAESFKKVSLEDIRNEIFEFCGDRVITFKELFEFALLYIDTSRPVIGVPKKFFLPLIPFFSLLPEPIMTLDQYYMLEKDNVCSKNFRGVKDLLGKVRDAFNI
ncbi:MAG: complex I NDUFA9 subunit family protein [Hydrogenothermaceae bacterium]